MFSCFEQSALLLWSALQSRLSYFSPYLPTAWITDFLLNVGAILFATTAYSNSPLLLNLLLVTPAVLFLLVSKQSHAPARVKPVRAVERQNVNTSEQALDPFPVHPFLTSYRGSMMIATTIAILAVDFRVFPRRFAKVENWGTSLMDLGVGSFVFSAGVVSARSVLKTRHQSTGPKTMTQRLIASIRHSIPLLILGLIRLYSVKGLDYAEHVTEYGVHWNFFFTLGCLPPFVEIFHTLISILPSYEALSLLIAVAYQVALESTDLKGYILVSPRGPGLLSKNREGVFSLLGYLAIFLAGRATGLRIIPRGTPASRNGASARKRVLFYLAGLTTFWSLLFALNSSHLMGYGASIPVSRRLANMPYVLWVAAFNNAQIFLFCLIETICFPDVHRAADKSTETKRIKFATSRVMAAFNKNGLVVFLIANLLTGAVNLTIRTLDANTWQAMTVLVLYSSMVASVAMGLDMMNIKISL